MGNLSRTILKFLAEIKSSYWFIPTLMLTATIGLSFISIELDARINIDKESAGIFGWIFSNQVDGTRQILSTIASTMMTVAGVTFSMTLISISFAGSQIGPRILSNFMLDKGNQITLGTFISTFVFCLLVLRSVNSNTEGANEFIPHISLLIAIVFAFLSLGVLIYFIHHIPQKMSMTESVDSTGDDLLKCIDTLYLNETNNNIENKNYEKLDLNSLYTNQKIVKANGKGFIELINVDALIKAAIKYDCVIEVLKKPGDYICEGVNLLCVHSNGMNNKDYNEMRNSIIWGVKRSNNQDIMFPGQLLVEIAARALSPGINDPYSAIECLNQLQAAFVRFSSKELPSKYKRDESKTLRVIFEYVAYDEFFTLLMNSLRSFVKTDYLCTKRTLELLSFLATLDEKNTYSDLYKSQARFYFEAFKKNTADIEDIKIIENQYLKMQS